MYNLMTQHTNEPKEDQMTTANININGTAIDTNLLSDHFIDSDYINTGDYDDAYDVSVYAYSVEHLNIDVDRATLEEVVELEDLFDYFGNFTADVIATTTKGFVDNDWSLVIFKGALSLVCVC